MKKILLISILLCFAMTGKADEIPTITSPSMGEKFTTFANYAAYCHEVFDISVSMPAGFTDAGMSGFYCPRAKRPSSYHPANMFGAMLRSADGNCVVLLSDMKLRHQWGMKNATKDNCGGDFMGDVYFAVRGAWTHEYFFSNPPLIDISRYSKSVPAERFNAERANIVWLPANDSIDGKHFCAKNELFFGKSGRPVYDIVVLFTAEGAKDKSKYLEPIYDALKFGDNENWTFSKETDDAAIDKYMTKDEKPEEKDKK